MPTIEENLRHWSTYDWNQHDEEWSEVWGTSSALWHGTLMPRLADLLESADCILEIAPGFGRFTRFLKDHCRRLVIVDLTEQCIQACRERFRDATHIEFHTNDGRTLPMVADRSVDFVFSFDSLVHVERDAVTSYLFEIARVLTADGIAFIHHSNMGAFMDPSTRTLTVENRHWRATSVSAALVRSVSESAGLSCVFQEIINWGVPELTDCLSIITRHGSRRDGPPRTVENPGFMDEAIHIGRIVKQYSLP
jgi:SAM-dependent methyltransferase